MHSHDIYIWSYYCDPLTMVFPNTHSDLNTYSVQGAVVITLLPTIASTIYGAPVTFSIYVDHNIYMEKCIFN